ncbi:predicted protein [Nematostella vectensis]|uniref:UspA domain-containing protein n=1 Tax=Nematostella vectensis TaxID=45351 RepID=A7RRQ2_NEMVE|nr:predicted protein [Nematostella vectensis]|eukprot:XP_001637863.1 predicted protein [Nematostella vectensis]
MASEEPKKVRRILLPIDSSKHSEDAFEWYVNNMHHEEDELILVHVLDSAAIQTRVSSHGLVDDEFKNEMNKGLKEVKALEEKYKTKAETASLKAKIEVRGGKPGETICQCSKDEHCDLILMGSRGLGSIRRTILGSVSDYVLHHAHVPTIIIPKK